MFVKKMADKYGIFYGWFIVAAGFILMSCSMGIAYNCASLFLKPVSEEFGISRQQINATITIRFMSQTIIALFSGRIFSKYNLKRLMQISALVLPIAYFSYSLSNTVIVFYGITLIMSICVVMLTVLPLSLIINNWFYERQGFAIGMAFMGSGAGGMLFNSLAGIWISAYGWRTTYQILSLIMALTIIPAVFLIIHIRPRDIGLSPLGEPAEKDISSNGEDGMMLSEARKTVQFWTIAICAVGISMCNNTMMSNIAPHLTDVGYSTTFSANIVALTMGSLAIFKVVLGQLYDKLGVRKATTIFSMAILIGLTALIFPTYNVALVIIVICVGLGTSSGSMANPILTREIFGRRDYSAIYGILTACGGIGGIVAPMISGYVFDNTGSYNLAYMIMIVVIIITIIAYQILFSKTLKSE